MLTTADEHAIANAVAQAEAATAGEIVCIVAEQAGDYRFTPILWASLIALALPWPLMALTDWQVARIFAVQLLVFGALGAAIALGGFSARLTPRRMKREQAHRAAREQFLARGLHKTRGRVGVMIYVAVAERHAEIVADSGIDARLAPDAFRAEEARLVTAVAAGRLAAALIETIGRCSAILVATAPPDTGANELPDGVVRA